jgi:GT2 family glycosyltransferase
MTAGAERARRCLERVADCAGEAGPVEVIVVDNGARPDVRRLLREDLDGAVLVTSEVDLGIPYAWRCAFALARAPRILLIHEDTELAPGAVRALAAALDGEPRAGAAAARLLGTDGRPQSAGRIVWADGYDDPVEGVPQLDGSEPFPVDRPSSATALFDRAAYEATPGFDPRFFPATCVDSDIGLALHEAGTLVLCAPDAVVTHASAAMVQEDGGPMRSGVFRHFLQRRAYPRMAEKWRERLAGHVDRSAGLDAGLAAAAERAARAPGLPPGTRAAERPAPPRRVEAPAELQAEAAQARVDLRDEFLAWLVERDGILHREIAWRDAALQEQRGHLERTLAWARDLEAWAHRAQAEADAARSH